MSSYILLGLLTQFLVPAAVVVAAYAVGKLVARRLGIPEFRMLKPGAPETRWKRLFVRSSSVLAGLLVCFALGFAAVRVRGVDHPTMAVDVVEGPARHAGIRDGDRIVAVDGLACETFEALRNDIRASTGPRKITLERNGERMTFDVTPREGRIGVAQRIERHAASVADATWGAFGIALAPLRYFVPSREPRVLTGPVGVVRDLASSGTATWLWVAALYAAYAWLAIGALHVFDALLLRFRRAGEGKAST